MEVPSLGVKLELSCLPTSQPQGNTDPLTHGARPGIEPTSSWILVASATAEPQRERPVFLLLEYKTPCSSSPKEGTVFKTFACCGLFCLAKQQKLFFFSFSQNSVSMFLFSTGGQRPSSGNTTRDTKMIKSQNPLLLRKSLKIYVVGGNGEKVEKCPKEETHTQLDATYTMM